MYISNALTGTTYLTLPMFIPYGINIAAFSALTYQGTSEDNVLSFENVPNPELGYTDTTTSLSSSFEPSDFNVLPKRGDFVYVDSIMECRRIKDVVYSSTPIDLNNLPLEGSYFVLEEPFTTRVISQDLYIIRKEDLEKGGVAYPVINLEISEWDYGHASIVTTTLGATSVIKTGQNPKESEVLFFKSDGCIVHGYLVSGLDV